MGQRLPAGQHVRGHRIQKQHPVQTGVAVHGWESLGHSATARIAMGAHKSGTPTMASQQQVTIKPLHRLQTIAQLHQAVEKKGGCQGDQRPAPATGPCPQQPRQQAQHQSGQETAPPRSHGLLQPLSNIAPQISQRRPWKLEHFDALDPQLTPTALAGQTFCRSQQQRVYRWQRTPQHPVAWIGQPAEGVQGNQATAARFDP